MSNNTNDTLSITFSGNLVIRQDEVEQVLRAMLPGQKPQPEVTLTKGQAVNLDPGSGGVPRLAFTIDEAAEALGLSYATLYRLLQRGLLKRSLAVRRIIIPRTELERFLKETTSSI
jgi:excisionase family DNA binding protein